MAITLVQAVVSAAGSSVSLGSPTTAGNCVVVGYTDEGGATGVTAVKLGGAADNFAQLVAASGTVKTTVTAALWADPNCAGGQTAIAVTPTGTASSPTIWAAEFSGIVSASPLDKQTGTTGNSSSWSSGSTATTTQATELWVGALCNAASAGAAGPSSPWNNTNVNDISGDRMVYGYNIVSSTGAAAYSGTGGSASGWAAVVATLKGTTGTSGKVQPLPTDPVPRRKRLRAIVGFTPVTTTNPSGPAGTVQSGAAQPAPRRKRLRAVVAFTPVPGGIFSSGVTGKVQPESAVPAPRRKRLRAVVGFTPVTTTNATGGSGRVQPQATVPIPRRKRLRAIAAGLAVPGIRGAAPRQQPYMPPRRKRLRARVGFKAVATSNAGRQLLISLASQPGTDDYGTAFPQGILATAGVIEGPVLVGSDAFFYSPSPGFGNLTQSIAEVSGVDAYGNAYISGTATYANNGTFWSAVVIDSGVVTWYMATGPGGPWTSEAGIGFSWNNLTGGGLNFTGPAGNSMTGDLNVSGSITVTATLTVNGTDVGATLSAIHAALSGASTSTNGLPNGTITGTSGGASTGTAHTHGPGSFSVTNGQHSHTLPTF